jgi:hypothetical protein
MGRKPNSEKHVYVNNNNNKSSSENFENSSNDSSIKTSPVLIQQNKFFDINHSNQIDKRKNNSTNPSENKTTALCIYKNDKKDISIKNELEQTNSIKSIINQIITFANQSEFQSKDGLNSLVLNDKYQSKIFSMENLQNLLENSNLVINRYHNGIYPQNPQFDLNSYLILPMLRDKVYQTFVRTNTSVANMYEKALNLIKNDVKIFNGHDADLKQIWKSLMDSIPLNVKNFVTFAKQIPGLNELSNQDLNFIINNRLFDYFIIKHAPLFINGESYMLLPNSFQYSKYWLEKVVGKEMTSAMFDFSTELNGLKLTSKEIALMLAYVITLNGKLLF